MQEYDILSLVKFFSAIYLGRYARMTTVQMIRVSLARQYSETGLRKIGSKWPVKINSCQKEVNTKNNSNVMNHYKDPVDFLCVVIDEVSLLL